MSVGAAPMVTCREDARPADRLRGFERELLRLYQHHDLICVPSPSPE